MPATRSNPQGTIQTPYPTSSPPKAQKKRAVKNTNIIDLIDTSDASSSSSSIVPQAKPKSRSRPPPRSTPAPTFIIDISSDDDQEVLLFASPKATVRAPTPEPARIAEYRRDVAKYRTESMKHKRDFEKAAKELEALRKENQELQALQKPGDGKVVLDVSKINDHLDCEICTGRMWAPYVLPDCGHTFCQSCLQDWFGATQAQYIAAHPEYNPNQPLGQHGVMQLHAVLQTMMLNPAIANNPQVKAMMAHVLPPHPEYTCPTCREQVKSRPTEAFALKSLVRTIAAATGESSPKKPVPAKGRGKAAATNVAGPWDGFFPKKP